MFIDIYFSPKKRNSNNTGKTCDVVVNNVLKVDS